MYTFYYVVDGIKHLESYATYDEVVDRITSLSDMFTDATSFNVTILDTDMAQVRVASK